MIDYSKLRGRIVEKFGTMGSFADKAGISRQALSLKLNGKIGLDTDNILHWCELLDITNDEIPLYFFTLKV